MQSLLSADAGVAGADEVNLVLSATGVPGTGDAYDTAYGREVVHADPDHSLIRFVAPRG